MHTEIIKLSIDRIEEGIAVAYDSSGKEYTFTSKLAELKESDIVNTTMSTDGEIIEITVLHSETAKTKATLKMRLSNLFAKQERNKK